MEEKVGQAFALEKEIVYFLLINLDIMRQVIHHIQETISNESSDQTWYIQFRIGTYIDDQLIFNENSQFPRGEESLDQFFLQMTPDTAMDSLHGDQIINTTLVVQAVAACY